MNGQERPMRLLRFLLWLCVIGSCLGIGAKLFDLAVLATAWGASPPESLALMPYGPRYPLDPGDFFIPLSILILIGYFGALAAGWSTRYRRLLIVPCVMIVIMAVVTPTVFWPMIRELYGAGLGTVARSQAELAAVVQRWFVLDILRTLLIVISLACHIAVLNRLARPKTAD